MTRYSAEELERQFKQVAKLRKGKKEYEDDAGYWDGGKCNWGASHNLKEDCETIAKSFNQIESLIEIKKDLQKCTSSQEYEAKKANYIRKCEESINGLQTQTSSSSSMFGICIIWADQATNKGVISKLNVCREGLTKLKSDLQRETYKWVQELNQLKFEERQITQRMESNKRKAMSKDISPSEKVTILQIIEEDGQILKKNYEKQKEISNKFNFDPSKKANDLIEKMKRAIEKRNRRNSSSGGNKGNQTDSDDSDSEDEITENRDENPRTTPLNQEVNDNQPIDWWKENQELLLITSGLLLTAYLYYQNEKTE